MTIGQRVVCIDDTEITINNPPIHKGTVYKIVGMKEPFCKCHPFVVNVGIDAPGKYNYCGKCLERGVADGIWWFHPARFAPIEERGESNIEQFISPLEEKK